MGKTRNFKKIRDAKGTFHAKMGTIKDRNDMDLTEAEDTKKWQEYTEELYKKDLHDPHNHDGVITHLEPDILECEVKSVGRWPEPRSRHVLILRFDVFAWDKSIDTVGVLEGGDIKGFCVFFPTALIIIGDDVLTDIFFLEDNEWFFLLSSQGHEQHYNNYRERQRKEAKVKSSLLGFSSQGNSAYLKAWRTQASEQGPVYEMSALPRILKDLQKLPVSSSAKMLPGKYYYPNKLASWNHGELFTNQSDTIWKSFPKELGRF